MSITFSDLGKMGRLGNILFQASATIALALDNNVDYQFPKFWSDRKYFNIPEEKFVDKLYYLNNYKELNYHYNKIIFKDNLNLNGYFQSYYYFNSQDKIIKKLLTPNIIINKQDYVSLHVRRTDYLIHNNCYKILNRNNYYDKAMEISSGKKFLIFSDDINWCKQNFTGNEFDFVEGNNAPTDLKLMANCLGGNIIANSSFSWWGAYLNENINNCVISPNDWFGPELSMNNTKDLYLPSWIRI